MAKTVEGIQKEIMTNGPVEAAYTVYEDFYQYKGGVYVVSFRISLKSVKYSSYIAIEVLDPVK